jgi:hypothetical protein
MLLVVVLCMAMVLAPARAKGGEFSPSVVLTSFEEMQNNCESMVRNALSLNAKSIKFVPTVHYYGSESSLNSYCFRCGIASDVRAQDVQLAIVSFTAAASGRIQANTATDSSLVVLE